MPDTRAAKELELGHLIPPRVQPGGFEMLVSLFDAIEDFAPEALESLIRDVVLTTLDRLGPIETGTEIMGRWSEGLERWQSRFNLDRWKSPHHSRSFNSVAHLVLLGLETTRQIDSDSAWSNWKATISSALSPEVIAFSEWRLLEAADPEMARRLTLQPPTPKGWNPILESRSTWREGVERDLDEYERGIKDALLQVDVRHRPTKYKAREHFELLVRYQVREERFNRIADAIYFGQVHPGRDPESRVKKAVQLTAGTIGLILRGRPGRPRNTSS